MKIAVSSQYLLFSMAFTAVTSHVCSSRGVEFPGWPFWNFLAFTKVTQGKFPSVIAERNRLRSYW